VKGRKPKSIMIAAQSQGLAAMHSSPAASSAPLNKLLARVDQIVHWPGQAGYVPPKPPPPLTPQQQAQFEAGKVVFTAVCAQCHQPTGLGKEGTAPPLVGSEWVLGPERRVARIVVYGLRGPVSVGGKSYSYDMPALGSLSDDQIAAVLTYVRRSWDHEASPVDVQTVREVRAEGRGMPWTERELLRTR
jgi:mono/diheme cytochrome c family protein